MNVIKTKANAEQTRAFSGNFRLLKQLQTVKTPKTVADCQYNCRQLQTIPHMFVIVCIVRLSVSDITNGLCYGYGLPFRPRPW